MSVALRMGPLSPAVPFCHCLRLVPRQSFRGPPLRRLGGTPFSKQIPHSAGHRFVCLRNVGATTPGLRPGLDTHGGE